jgi:hypothetical protein
VALRIVGGLNMIRGFFIFLIFICKPSIWKMTRKRHPKLVQAFARPFNFVWEKWSGFVPVQSSELAGPIQLTEQNVQNCA